MGPMREPSRAARSITIAVTTTLYGIALVVRVWLSSAPNSSNASRAMPSLRRSGFAFSISVMRAARAVSGTSNLHAASTDNTEQARTAIRREGRSVTVLMIGAKWLQLDDRHRLPATGQGSNRNLRTDRQGLLRDQERIISCPRQTRKRRATRCGR